MYVDDISLRKEALVKFRSCSFLSQLLGFAELHSAGDVSLFGHVQGRAGLLYISRLMTTYQQVYIMLGKCQTGCTNFARHPLSC
jgi:hypothetical protein